MSTVNELLNWMSNSGKSSGVGSSLANVLSAYTSGNDANSQIGANNSALDSQIKYLSDMYDPNGAVAQQMAREMAAKDAKAGRNSQYGARSALLQSQLASGASSNAARIAQLIAQKQQSQQAQQKIGAQQLGSLFDLATKTGLTDWAGGQLKDMFQRYTGGGSQEPNYSLSGLPDSGSPQGLSTTYTPSDNPFSIQTGNAPGLSNTNPDALMPDWSTPAPATANTPGTSGLDNDNPYQWF